jgi:predicted methyltransferase
MAIRRAQFDLRRAVNAVSDVIQNRPLPLREFDQIYMKTGDMVLQTELVARRFDKQRMIFIGDGDSIGLCLAYLKSREVLDYGPSKVLVVDFDERIVNAVLRFANREGIDDLISARLYNCFDPLPADLLASFDVFYTNPPWGASNDGESVKVFADRGIEALVADGAGVVVVADDPEVEWTKRVLLETQQHLAQRGFFVQEMQSQLHAYHLDDAPDLRSCNIILRASPGRAAAASSAPLGRERIEHFYGNNQVMRVKYVREARRVDYGKAPDATYQLELLGDGGAV